MKRIFSTQYEASELDFYPHDISFWSRHRTLCVDDEDAVQLYQTTERAFHLARSHLIKLADSCWWNHVFPYRTPEFVGSGMTETVVPYPRLDLPEPGRNATVKIMRQCEEIDERIRWNVHTFLEVLFDSDLDGTVA